MHEPSSSETRSEPMKKVLFGLGVAAVCFASAAGAQQAESSYSGALTSADLAFDGVYGGVLLSSHSNTSLTNRIGDVPYANGSGVGFYAGYSQRMNDFALGAEVSIDNMETCETGGDLCMSKFMDLSLRAGYVINDFQVFALGGLSSVTNGAPGEFSEVYAGTHIGIGVEYEMESGAQVGVVLKDRRFSFDSGFLGPDLSAQTRSVELRVGYSF